MNGLTITVNTTDVVGLCVALVVGVAIALLVDQIKKGGKAPTWRNPKDKK